MGSNQKDGLRALREDKTVSCIVSHDSNELLLIDFAILVEVKFVNHSLSEGSIEGKVIDK